MPDKVLITREIPEKGMDFLEGPNMASKRVLSKIGMSYEREEKHDDGSTIEYFAIEKNGRA